MSLFRPTAIAALLVSSFAANANLVTNGSFENTQSFSGHWTLLNQVNGWTNEGAKFEIQKSSLGIIAAQDGNQYLELDSTANYAISQSIATSAGQDYVLSFYYSPRVKNNDSTNRASVKWDGVEVIALNSSSVGWQKVQVVVKATSNQSTLVFAGAGKSDSYGALIDNISLTPKAARPVCATGLFGINRKGSADSGYLYLLDTTSNEYSIMANVQNTASNLAAADGKLYFMEKVNEETDETVIWQYGLDSRTQSEAARTTSYFIYRSAIRDDKQAIRATSITYMYDFDLATGERTVLGQMKYNGTGVSVDKWEEFKDGDIAYSADGNTLYVLSGTSLYTLDVGSMELSKIGEHGIKWASGIAVSDTNDIFISGRNSKENAKIYRLDPQTAAATFVMDGPSHINDLAYSSDSCN